MGRIDIRFKEPFSLAGYIAEQAVQRRGSKRPQQTVLLRALGYRVLSDINSVAVIMPAALVGTVLLTIRGRGVGRNELVRRVNGLIAKIKERGGKVANFDGMEIEEVVEKALIVIKSLVSTQTDLIEPTYSPSDRFQLSFYRNQVCRIPSVTDRSSLVLSSFSVADDSTSNDLRFVDASSLRDGRHTQCRSLHQGQGGRCCSFAENDTISSHRRDFLRLFGEFLRSTRYRVITH